MDKELAEQMLKSIALTGSAEVSRAVIKPIIANNNGGNIKHILNLSSGSPRLHSNVINRFKLILSQPEILEALSRFEVRCCLCNRVVSYPCWYYSVKYAVNQFHYFVCFDLSSPDKPSTKCYRRV